MFSRKHNCPTLGGSYTMAARLWKIIFLETGDLHEVLISGVEARQRDTDIAGVQKTINAMDVKEDGRAAIET